MRGPCLRRLPAPARAHTHAFCPALVNHTVSSFAAVTRGERGERLAAAVSQIRVTVEQKCFQTPQNNKQDAVNHRDPRAANIISPSTGCLSKSGAAGLGEF